LDLVHPGAVLGHGLAGLLGGDLGGGAVLVGGAQEQDLVAAAAQVAGVKVGGSWEPTRLPRCLMPLM
jgi:hypothetical protein